VCQGGKCVGWIDYCLRDDVKCGTRNPCLLPKGTCHPRSGACVFEKQPNGVNCSSAPGLDFDGICDNGLCRKIVLDKCANVNCTKWLEDKVKQGWFGDCLDEPMCDPYTGECKVAPRPEGMKCTSGSAEETFNDMCIEGQCIGDLYDAPMFKKFGDGFCADEEGKIITRYFADTFDRDECEKQCADDSACVAYSFGFHYCSIYGGPHSKHPSVERWGMLWMLGTLTGDDSSTSNVVSSVTEPEDQQQKVECWLKVDFVESKVEETPIGHTIAFGSMVALLTCAPAIWLILWKLRQHPEQYTGGEEEGGDYHQDPIAIENLRMFEALKAEGGLLALHRGDADALPPPSPRNSTAIVAAAPNPESPHGSHPADSAEEDENHNPMEQQDQGGTPHPPDPRGEVDKVFSENNEVAPSGTIGGTETGKRSLF